jgi:translation elongation factor EF-Tu-like GTPase
LERVTSKYIKARLKLFPTNSGGRLSGIRSGYRPNHVFEYVEGQILCTFIGEVQFEELETIEPGEEKDVSVRFLFVPELEHYLQVGRRWWLHEGGRRIGEAVITEI